MKEARIELGSNDQMRWWSLPSWLGLDAPCVVTTWTWAIAWAAEKEVQLTAMGALFFTVWSVYLLDRLIDVFRCPDWSKVTGRMKFGKDYRRLFLTCLLFSLFMLGIFVFSRQLADEVIKRGLGVACGLLFYLILFVLPVLFRDRLPGKEFFVGLFFALGAFAVLGVESESLGLFVGVWFLVTYNCLVIAARERETDELTDPSGASQWWKTIDRDLTWVGIALVLAACCFVNWYSMAFSLSLASAFSLLVLLHWYSKILSANRVRACADFCLFTPWAWFITQILSVET